MILGPCQVICPSVVQALVRRVQTLRRGLMASLTRDRGLELAAYHAFTIATDVQVYFCDPHSPWQRGSNENTNRQVRSRAVAAYTPPACPCLQASGSGRTRLSRRLARAEWVRCTAPAIHNSIATWR